MKLMTSETTRTVAAIKKFTNAEGAVKEFDFGRCGNRHRPRNCLAFRKKCANCHFRIHSAKMRRKQKKMERIHQEDLSDDKLFIETINYKRNYGKLMDRRSGD